MNKKLLQIMSDYINTEKSPKTLVIIDDDPNIDDSEFKELGFSRSGNFYSISKSDAQAQINKLISPPDYNAHWENEQERLLKKYGK